MYPPHPPHPPGGPHPFDPGQCEWDFMHEQQRRQQEEFAYLARRDAQERATRAAEAAARTQAEAATRARAQARARHRQTLMLCVLTGQSTMAVRPADLHGRPGLLAP